jgi:O-antigen/teichoic acid export membrane protein
MPPAADIKSPTTSWPLAPLSLRRNFSWTFAGNVVYAAAQWGILVLLAKLGSPEMVGQFALGLAITAPVILFANLQLRSVQATDARRDYTFADYLGLRLLTTLAAYAVIVAIVLIAGYGQETALVILFIGAAKAFEAISDIFFGLLQQHERMDRIAKSLMIEGPLTLAVMGLILYGTRSVAWATLGMAVVWALQLALYDLRSGLLILGAGAWQRALPRFRMDILRRLAWLALPLGFVMLLISLNTNIPRYVIERYLGKEQLGIFAAMAYLMVAGTTVVFALGQSASPRLSQYYSDQNYGAYWRLLRRLLMLGAGLGGVGIVITLLFGQEILTIFYGETYGLHTDILTLIVLASSIGYCASFLGYGMTAARYFRAQMPVFAVVVATTTVMSFMLIPRLGLAGAALTMIVAALVQFVLSFAILRYALRKV